MEARFLGVDVGTGSARAGVFDAQGNLLAAAAQPIAISRPHPDFCEQDSENIWRAVATAVRSAVRSAQCAPTQIRGLGFDATCSLVVRDEELRPLHVSPDAAAKWDTIVWMDHRARIEAEECTATGAEVLDYVGGVMSPEMETPKLMWLKRHHPKAWSKMGGAFDLTDFLTWRATGIDCRSVCTMTCKWTYLAHKPEPWDHAYLDSIGLEDFWERTGAHQNIAPVGTPIGELTEQAADELGLTTSCVIGAGLIDAHAGALGTLGPHLNASLDQRIAVIAGTSTCVMALSAEARFINGVWGPYCGGVVDGWWLNEGGQSISGALLDFILELHPAGRAVGVDGHEKISGQIMQAYERGEDIAPRLHVLPDFYGNRSPLADANALGVISGLTTDLSESSLVRLYWATACSIAYGLRHIVEHMNAQSYAIDTVHLSGGQASSPLLRRLYADATGCTVVLASNPEPVLLGSAMVGAVAAGEYSSLSEAGGKMAADGLLVEPDPRLQGIHDRRYRAFLALHMHRHELDRLQ